MKNLSANRYAPFVGAVQLLVGTILLGIYSDREYQEQAVGHGSNAVN